MEKDVSQKFGRALVTSALAVAMAMASGGGAAWALTESDCRTCHNTLQVNGTYSTADSHHSVAGKACLDCHKIGAGNTIVAERDCLICHINADHATVHDPISRAAECAACHTLSVVDEHTSRGGTCATCHSSTTAAVVTAISDGKLGKPVSCASCHGTPDHLLQHDHATTALECGSCHRLGVVKEHTTRTSTCATCHSSSAAVVQGAIIQGKAGINVTCVNCHGGTNHLLQHDRATTASGCANCHTKGVLDEHLTRTSTCSTCHSSTRTAVVAAISAGKSGTSVDCVSCHGNFDHPNAHEGKVLAPYADCGTCHNPNLVKLHQESGFGCSACHSSTNATVSAVVTKGLSGQVVYCAQCHVAFGNHEIQHDKVALADATSFIAKHEQSAPASHCFGCHTNTAAGVVKAIDDGMKGLTVTCTMCHPTMTPPNVPPVANAGSDVTGLTNQAFTFSGAGSSDVDGSIISWQWKFGDGATATGVTASHAYTTPGSYSVTLTVTDDAGATATDTAIVTVQQGAVYAPVDEALSITRLSSVTTGDAYGTRATVTAYLKDSNFTTGYPVSYSSRSGYSVLTMKRNVDAGTAAKVILRLYVSSISGTQTVRIYPYVSGFTGVNTAYSSSYSISGTGWKELDVTTLAQKMVGFGGMKFRVTTAGSFSVSESNFTIQ